MKISVFLLQKALILVLEKHFKILQELTKITENAGARTEMSLSTSSLEKPKSVNMWKDFGFFGSEICEFNIEKVNMPENTLFYVNQEYQSYKDNKKVY